MNRIDYLNKYLESKGFNNGDNSVIIALIYALTPQEACEFFDLTFLQEYHIRRYLLRKISNDIAIDYLPEHSKLMDSLLKLVELRGFKNKASCFSSIDFLYDYLPNDQQNKILHIFLTSKSYLNRDRGYKNLNKNWNVKYQEQIEQFWIKFHDTHCLDLIINNFPVEYLYNNHKDLIQYADSFQISRLFINLSKEKPHAIEILKKIDPISYAYVLVKINGMISSKDAREIIKEKMEDKRIGLLLWCFGRMRKWDILVEYIKEQQLKQLKAPVN